MKLPEPAHQAAPWIDGWYQIAHRLPSPNCGARPIATEVDLIVLHSISLPPGQYGGDNVQRLFTNRLDWNAHPYFKSIQDLQVSSHFYIRRDGELWQFVSANQRAWNAGVSSYRGRTDCNDRSIGIELEGAEDERFEDHQYDALAGLCRAILQRYPIKDIAGHEHIAPGRKTDPGPGFDWPRLQQSVALAAQCFPDHRLPKDAG